MLKGTVRGLSLVIIFVMSVMGTGDRMCKIF